MALPEEHQHKPNQPFSFPFPSSAPSQRLTKRLEAEAAKNWATLFRGEAGTIEKGIASKHSKLAKAHAAAAAALFDVHTIHKGKTDE